MIAVDPDTDPASHDAALAAALFAVDPVGTQGVILRGAPGLVRDRWLALVRASLPGGAPIRRVPPGITDDRLLGGLDLAATLGAGRAVVQRGVLADADGGILLLAMAERLPPETAARIAAAVDQGTVILERDGFAERVPTRFGFIALDEGRDDGERAPGGLRERAAFHVGLDACPPASVRVGLFDPGLIADARARLAKVVASAATVKTLCSVAAALGIDTVRAPLHALRVARAHAALEGRTSIADEDAAAAARLVLAPRATVVPALEAPPRDEAQPTSSDQADERGFDSRDGAGDDAAEASRRSDDVVLAAARAALPADLLARLAAAGGLRTRKDSAGRAGTARKSFRRGRPLGAIPGELRPGARLNLVETLRAAAPWQRLRRLDAVDRAQSRIAVRREDFRIARFKRRTQTTTIFVVDASGSAAAARLAESKGAVELLLAECYARRDMVALIAFRDREASLVLPPTRSLVRAKRCLAGLPGGGATPLAAAIRAAAALAETIRRRGGTPLIVLLADGRPNIALDGSADRARAEADSIQAARHLGAAGVGSLLVDTSPRPRPFAGRLASEMKARYVPLPSADAKALSRAVLASPVAGG